MLEMDFLEYHGDDYLSIVDVLTGFITCFKTRNKSSQEAIRCVREWTARWGRPFSAKSDYGPGFRKTCKEGLRGLGIKLVHSSSYNPRSMELAERSVRSIKNLLKKNTRLSQLELDELVFTINTNQQGANQGCALEQFNRCD